MKDVELKKAGLDELGQLQEISRHTFAETFSAANTAENMQKYLAEGFSEERLSAELQDQNSRFYFAKLGNRVIGYLKINFGSSQTELKDNSAVEIERIYVLREFQGQHVGQLLYDKAIEIAKQMNAEYVWLGVWEENPRAIHFYRKNGFVEFDKHLFMLGDDEQTDIMMKLRLT